jgi:transcriptional regulator with XRE-family HTH domain
MFFCFFLEKQAINTYYYRYNRKKSMFDSRRAGKIVRFHRKKAKLSQLELAERCGVGKTAVFDLEHGKETVRLSTVVKILKVLNIQIRFESPLMNLFEKECNEKS